MRRLLFQIPATLLVLLPVGPGILIVYALASAMAEHGTGWLGEMAALSGMRAAMVMSALALAASALAVGAALVLIWRAACRPDARAIALFLGLLALFWSSLQGFFFVSAFGPHPLPEAVGGATRLLLTLPVLTGWLVPAAFLRVAAFFPRRLDPSDPMVGPRAARLLDPRLVWGIGGGFGVALLLATAIGTRLGWDPLLETMIFPVAWAMTLVLVPAAVLGAVHLLRIGYRQGAPDDRARVRWMVAGFVASALALFGSVMLLGASLLFGPVVPAPVEYLGAGLTGAAPLLAVLGVIVGVFFSGSLDSHLVIRRTTVYGGLVVLLAFLFAGLESFMSIVLADRLAGLGRLGSWVSGVVTALVAASFHGPAKRMVAGRGPASARSEGG